MTRFALPTRTSATDPLRIDEVTTSGGGRIGMTICPGKHQRNGATAHWERDLTLDVARIAAWGAVAAVTLMEEHELERYGVPNLGAAVEAHGMEWHHLPIPDFNVPGMRFEALWTWSGHRLRTHLLAGGRVLLHCRGGLGRTGMIAARLLAELGTDPGDAIALVRRARPDTIETLEQEAHARAVQAIGPTEAAYTDRLLGCLLGGALGDALGYEVEFDPLDEIRRRFGPEGIREPVPHGGRLVVSDDTQMTLFTLEGLLRAIGPEGKWSAGGVVEEVRRAYIDWLDTQSGGCAASGLAGWLATRPAMRHRRAPGNTCLEALRAGGHGSIERPINGSKGCGAAMRSVPVAFLPGVRDGVSAFRLGGRIGALTHGHPDGWASAGVVGAAVWRLLRGEALDAALTGAIRDLEQATEGQEAKPTAAPYQRALHLAREMPDDPEAAIAELGGGWTGEEAVAIAAYAALCGRSFEDVLTYAANHDGDSDSTASIAGQIWGAVYGSRALPQALVRRLDVLEELLDLAAAANRTLRPFHTPCPETKVPRYDGIPVLILHGQHSREPQRGTSVGDISRLPAAEDFRAELRRRLDLAQQAKLRHVDIVSGDLHRDLGGYPGGNHQMPVCCSVMRGEMKEGDQILRAPPGGNGATLEVRYRLPR